ncbi:MAG TPA: alpha/beta fold hydrolase [Hellea balneolensis]|uniref:Alpha/beta fold hydrolase n=1 Tax=Hellea balneolensis TaxID=287478 RepID=A0A7V5U124_9PROT|nr:alpha/beta fold hydrolase [Hellea balneolensis]
MARQTDNLEKKAAETPTAVNSMIGIRRAELIKSLGVLAGHALRQPKPLAKNLAGYGKELVEIVKGKSELAPDRRDRRFQDPTWRYNRLYKMGLQSWIAMRKGFEGWINDSGIDEEDKIRARFVLDILADSLAPTNTLLGNPAAMKRLYESGGMSIIKGLKNAYHDLRTNGGMPSMVDGSKFEVGKNLATTPGSVIFKNEMLEVIQYKPVTEQVYETPLVIIPPQINKFYANDLSPHNSVVKYFASQGYQMFAISWRNPERHHSHWGLENYVQSLIEATDAIMKITRTKKINVSGACSGGITLAHLLSELAARGDERINAYTLMVSVLDPRKSDSEIGLFASDAAIEAARKMSQRKGVLPGEQLARAFAWMRPNDLIWNYVVNNYLLGEDPPAFDILYWNSDTTNLPAQLHSDYLDMFSDHRFQPGSGVEFMGHEIDLKAVKQDGFMLAAVTDHITPWRACYRNTGLFGGNIEFVLSSSGHIQALLNPPGNPKAKFFTNDKIEKTSDEWLQGARENPGSWWPYWDEWLSKRSGKLKSAPKRLGNKSFPPLSKAPGEYVFT